MASLSCDQQAVTSLILKSSLLPWIATQMSVMRIDEHIPWIKILENILIVADVEKLEKATNGVWRWVMMKSLNVLAHETGIENSCLCLLLLLISLYDRH